VKPIRPGRIHAVKSIRDAIGLVKKRYKIFYSRDHDWKRSSTVKGGTETLLHKTKPNRHPFYRFESSKVSFLINIIILNIIQVSKRQFNVMKHFQVFCVGSVFR
jgi:hypothetical protein